MNDLQRGQYIILPARQSAPPPSPVGANLEGPPVEPVIAGGREHVWLADRNENGTYTLVLRGFGMSKPGKDDVIVESMPGPRPGEWTIQRHGESYMIEEAREIFPTRKWTLRDTMPGTKVELRTSESPMPDQLWRILPFLDE